MTAIHVGPVALAELADAILFLDDRRAGAGEKLRSAVDAAVLRIAEMPHTWPRVAGGLQRAPVRGYAYWIVYAYSPGRLDILSVFHSRREPRNWRE